MHLGLCRYALNGFSKCLKVCRGQNKHLNEPENKSLKARNVSNWQGNSYVIGIDQLPLSVLAVVLLWLFSVMEYVKTIIFD